MDPFEAFAQAQAAIDAGEDPMFVSQQVAALTQFSGMAELKAHVNRFMRIQDPERRAFASRMALESQADAQTARELHEIADHPVRNLAGSMFQGPTFNLGDEGLDIAERAIRSLQGEPDQARRRRPTLGQRMGEAHAQRLEHAPAGALIGEIMGGLLVPLGAGGAAMRTARPGAARGMLAGIARGSFTGGAAAGASAAGLAEPGHRLEAAASAAPVGAAVGGALTGLLGAGAGVLAARRGQGARLANEIAEAAEVPSVNRLVVRGRHRDAKTLISELLYKPVSRGDAPIMDPALNQTVSELSKDPIVGNVIRSHLEFGERRLADMAEGHTVPGRAAILFEEAQQLRRNLREIANDFETTVAERQAARRAADRLDDAMGDAFGEPLRAADRAWRRVSDRERAFEQGIKMYDVRSTDEIRQVMSEMTEAQQQAFRQGRLSEISAALGRRETDAVGLLQDMLDAGPELTQSMRELFPAGPAGDAAFETFHTMLQSEARDRAIIDFFNSSVKAGAIGAAGGIAASTVFSPFRQRGGGER